MKTLSRLSVRLLMAAYLITSFLITHVPEIKAQTATKPSGALELDDSYSPEAELMAYAAVSSASKTIAKTVCDNLTGKIVILDTETKAQIINYQNTSNILYSFRQRFTRELKLPNEIDLTDELVAKSIAIKLKQDETADQRAGVPFAEADQAKIALTAINGALGQLKELTDFFKTDVKEKGFKIEIDKDKLLPEVTHQIQMECSDVPIYNSKQVPFSIKGGSSPLMASLEEVYDLRYAAANLINIINGAQLAYKENNTEIGVLVTSLAANKTAFENSQKENATAEGDVKVILDMQIAKLENDAQDIKNKLIALRDENGIIVRSFRKTNAVKSKLQAIIGQFDAFAATLFKAEDKSVTPLLNFLFEAERLTLLLNDPKTPGHVLEIIPNTVGSTRRIKRNLFLDLFFPTGRISFNGEATIAYSLFKNDGTILKSCIVKTYMDFNRFKKGLGSAPMLNTCDIP